MERVAVETLEPVPTDGAADARRLGEVLGTADVALNHYAVDPGERIAGLHAHADQEEVFVVLEGTATIETLDGPVELASGAAIRVAPGEYQSVTNDETRPLSVLAIGAPPDSAAVRIPLPCPECGHEFREPAPSDAGPVLVCPACDSETPATCPACGGEGLQAVLGHHGEPVSACADCGATTAPQGRSPRGQANRNP